MFLFEDLSASDRLAEDVYLDEVDRCGIYMGLLGNEYGHEDAGGLAPTEREFDRATAKGKVRLIFVKETEDKARHPKMRALIRKAGAQLIRRRFAGIPDLTAALYASLVDHLENKGVIQDRPFEARPCPGATLADVEAGAVTGFVRRARHERQFPLPITNSEYQRVTAATRKTSTRDLSNLVKRRVLDRVGTRRSARYVVAKKWDIGRPTE